MTTMTMNKKYNLPYLELLTVIILSVGTDRSEQTLQMQIRAQLFKTNDIVS